MTPKLQFAPYRVLHGSEGKLRPPAVPHDVAAESLAAPTSTLPLSAFPWILLQKSFWEGERKFLEPLMRFARGKVRGHIVSSQIDHGPP